MRFFIEVSYVGLHYAGFQIQENAKTIQGVIEEALQVIFKTKIKLTGSSRTDAQVNAYQNYFHFDYDRIISPSVLYNINAILPNDIVVQKIIPTIENAHARFSAVSREYEYKISRKKNPFFYQRAYYFPYELDESKLAKASDIFLKHNNYESFSKKNSQVNNFNCFVAHCKFIISSNEIRFEVKANRFLRGMVKAMVATSLRLATHKITEAEFIDLFSKSSLSKGCFSVPGYALYLKEVNYPKNIFLL